MTFVRVSDISSLLFCQRYCYFNLLYGEVIPAEISVMRELYFSRRAGIENYVEWARRKFFTLYDESRELVELFEKAEREFVYSEELDRLKSLGTEISLKREDIMLKGKLDELVKPENSEVKKPLILSYKAPEEGVWYRDRIKLASFCVLLEKTFRCNEGFVYYCSGELKEVEISRKDKYTVLKAVERVNKLKKGFVPEKPEDRESRCKNCRYRNVCEEKSETFASKFL